MVNSSKEFQVTKLIVALTIAQDEPPEKKYIAELMQLDSDLDIAVIRIKSDLNGELIDRKTLNLPYVPYGDSDELKLGDPVVIMGYPSIGGSSITLTRGEVAGFTSQDPYGNRAFVKTSATIAGGNSGGLATNAQGQMVGVPTQLGYGGNDQYADCRRLVDTNGDGVVDNKDTCIPTGGFINALRPIKLAIPFIDKAKKGEVAIAESVSSNQEFTPTTGKLVIDDDFSSSKSGWPVVDDETRKLEYKSGEYLITAKPQNQIVWVNSLDSMEDVEMSIKTRVVKTTGKGGYGLICRVNKNKEFYGFEVTEDGYFSIWKRVNDEFKFIQYWQKSDLVTKGNSLNLTATCVGDQLSLAVNDKLLTTVKDAELTAGGVGWFTDSLDKGNLVVAFDNYQVRNP